MNFMCFNAIQNCSLVFLVCVLFRNSYATVTNTPKSNCPKITKANFSHVLQVHCELFGSLLCLNLTR